MGTWLSSISFPVGVSLGISLLVVIGLLLANYFYDRGLPQYVSRKIGHIIGGVGYLLCIALFDSPWIPVVLSTGFTLLLCGARLYQPSTFRGVGGTPRLHSYSEIFFPLAGTVALYIGWGVFDSKWITLVSILFMAWGDAITGLIRAKFYGKEIKGNMGSVGMLLVCVGIIWIFYPSWIGLIGAVVATLAEKYTPLSKGFWDDNYTIVISSLIIMLLLLRLTGSF